jgi:hypothetical protein
VSNFGEGENGTCVISDVLERPDGGGADEECSIGPDDSVSCIDFAEKQRQQLAKLRTVSEDASMQAERESSTTSERSGTSVSLSSVSITERGPVIKKPAPSSSAVSRQSGRPPPPPIAETPEEERHERSDSDESSSVAPRRKKEKKARSYASLTENDSMYDE